MGKDLKGKEIGKYIMQLPNKKYRVTMPDITGKRHKRIFDDFWDAQRYVANIQYAIDHGSILSGSETTVDDFFNYWLKEFKAKSLRPNTLRNYKERYNINIRKHIGNMIISKVKGFHCQIILNDMVGNYATSTIKQVYDTLWGVMKYAEANDCIDKNPMKSVTIPDGNPSKPSRALTREEQTLFLEATKKCSNYNQFAFVLQTGLRTGELVGLKWEDVDFSKKTIQIRRSLEYRHAFKEWHWGPPKSKSGYRVIPLTDEAMRILENQKQKVATLDCVEPEFKDLVFLCRKGTPTKNSTYDTKIYYYCDKIGIGRFSMHTLRHTFATRCIEGGINPKFLQTILGHSTWNITMNVYVHALQEATRSEIDKVSDYLIIQEKECNTPISLG